MSSTSIPLEEVNSEVPVKIVNKSILIDRSVKRTDSNKKLQIKEKAPNQDEDRITSEEPVKKPKVRRRDMVITRIPTKVELKTLTHLAKRPAVDIEFQDLTYTVRNPGRKGQRPILKTVSGKFRAGELTAIMGPSGAGKSTLMNILVGYVSSGVTGMVKTNGHPRQLKLFHKLSSYIMQDDLIQPLLTVQESMEIAADLKLGNELNREDKLLAVEEVLRTLGLLPCRNTRNEQLSGGQRKRLSIALELVNNPPVIFLDEPTTGLDSVSIQQLLALLKLLAQQGRTIICTIHQPSASHFQQFDQVYILAKGLCVYQGHSGQLVPFLASAELHCPKTYNPADYVLEMIQGEFADNVKILSNYIQNGRLCKKADPATLEDSEIDLTRGITKLCRQETVAVMPAVFNHSLMDIADVTDYEFPTSFFQQLGILLGRTFVQQRRNRMDNLESRFGQYRQLAGSHYNISVTQVLEAEIRSALALYSARYGQVALGIQLFHHLFSAILIGSIFQGTGDDMTRPFANVKFCLCMVVFFLYTHVMTPVLLFPTGVKMMQREFFNRWYGLKAYYVAITISSLPAMIFFGFLFCLISYFLSSQPFETTRFLWFFTACITVGFVSEAHGLMVGSVFSVMNGSIVAPASFSPLLALAVYGMGQGDSIENYMRILMGSSYLRFGLVGITNSIYGHDRAEMACHGNDFEYCHYKDPNLYLRDLGMADVTTLGQILVMVAYAVVYRIVAYLLLRYRLTSEFSNQILNYAAKILKHK